MRGVYPIMTMPFDAKGGIDFEDVENQTEWLIASGVHGIGIAMASEVYKLKERERDEVLISVVEAASGRVNIVMNTGAEVTDVAIQYSKRAEELGANALMIRPTSYTPTVASEHIDYFVRIAEQVSIPIFLQDYGAVPVPSAMAVECARRHENLCYVRVETPPTTPQIAEASRIRGNSGLILFGGNGGAHFLEELVRGSVGTMPGSTLPDIFVRVWDLWQEGRTAGGAASSMEVTFPAVMDTLAA